VTITYTSGLGPAAWSGTLDVQGPTVTFTPQVPFQGGTAFSVTASGFQDLAGNAAADATFSFSTSGTPDVAPPTVTGVDVIPDGPSSADMVLHFSKPIAPIVSGTCSTAIAELFYGGGGQGVMPCLATRLPGGMALRAGCTAYGPSAVRLLGVTDKDGRAADPNVLFPFEAPPQQFFSETVYRPERGAPSVPPDTPIVIFATADFDPANLPGGVVVTANGDPVEGSLSSSGRTIVFMPSNPLPGGALAEVFVTDQLGVKRFPKSSWFMVAPSTTQQAVVLAATPAQASDVPTNAALRVRFSRPIDPATVDSATVALAATGPVGGAASLAAPDTVVFSPDQPLIPGVSHTLTVDGVKDLDGGYVMPFTRTFTTADGPDANAPSIVVVSPPEGALVGTNALLSAAFDGRLDPVSVNAATVTLHDELGPVPVRVSSLGEHIEITPLLPLAPGVLHTLAIDGVVDEAGNPAAPLSSTFSTSSGPDLAPAYVQPVVGPPNGPLEIATDRPLEAGRLTTADLGLSPPIAGSFSFSADQRVARFFPVGGWPPSSSFTLSTGAYQDAFDGFVTGYRTVGDEPAYLWNPVGITIDASPQSGAPPMLTSSSPADGATGVPRDAHPFFTFGERISADVNGRVVLSGPGGPVAARVMTGSTSMSIAPVLPLDPNTSYTITLTSLLSLLGVPLPSPITISFTTGPGFSN
jgi:hypothetical protein